MKKALQIISNKKLGTLIVQNKKKLHSRNNYRWSNIVELMKQMQIFKI